VAFNPECFVTGAIVPGVCDAPTEATYTVALVDMSTSGYSTTVPDSARYVELLLVNDTAANIYGAGAPVLSLRGGAGAVPQLIRDYTTGICVPPYPAPIGGYPNGRDIDDPPTVDVDTTVACDAVLQFFLEL
jgi:hypothetical protein